MEQPTGGAMRFEEMVLNLFDVSEDLRSMRDELIRITEDLPDGPEFLRLVCAIKEIDIVVVTLLAQYELLDTIAIVQSQLLSDYYARRLEILEMTRPRLESHVDELVAIGDRIEIGQGAAWIDRATQRVRSAIAVIDTIMENLRSRTMAAAKDQTLH
jgi:hypothetical protein